MKLLTIYILLGSAILMVAFSTKLHVLPQMLHKKPLMHPGIDEHHLSEHHSPLIEEADNYSRDEENAVSEDGTESDEDDEDDEDDENYESEEHKVTEDAIAEKHSAEELSEVYDCCKGKGKDCCKEKEKGCCKEKEKEKKEKEKEKEEKEKEKEEKKRRKKRKEKRKEKEKEKKEKEKKKKEKEKEKHSVCGMFKGELRCSLSCMVQGYSKGICSKKGCKCKKQELPKKIRIARCKKILPQKNCNLACLYYTPYSVGYCDKHYYCVCTKGYESKEKKEKDKHKEKEKKKEKKDKEKKRKKKKKDEDCKECHHGKLDSLSDESYEYDFDSTAEMLNSPDYTNNENNNTNSDIDTEIDLGKLKSKYHKKRLHDEDFEKMEQLVEFEENLPSNDDPNTDEMAQNENIDDDSQYEDLEAIIARNKKESIDSSEENTEETMSNENLLFLLNRDESWRSEDQKLANNDNDTLLEKNTT